MATSALPAITDPTRAPTYADGAFSRWCTRLIYESRDQVFLRLTLRMVAVMLAAVAALFALLHASGLPAWLPMLGYLAVWGWLVPPVILMLHNTMHRPFFRSRRLALAHPYLMSFCFGIPSGYREHHLGMHHFEDNLAEDLSSTLRYRRDSFPHFLRYFLRFLLVAVQLPLYLRRKKRLAMARRAAVGELVHEAVVVGALLLDWRFGLAAFLGPLVVCRFTMMAGNWGQHAFVNTARVNDGLSNAITCINSGYNRRCFNDGYHVGHHLRPNRHWTELPADLESNAELYAREGAIVFEGLDFFMVSLLLWTGRWGVLARRFVRLDGVSRSDEDVVAMLKSRVQPVRSWPQPSARGEAAPPLAA
ncbi:MAG TPA: fatty acid desaturase [Myxococcales bacterium]|jgi:fatty acid desaturase